MDRRALGWFLHEWLREQHCRTCSLGTLFSIIIRYPRHQGASVLTASSSSAVPLLRFSSAKWSPCLLICSTLGINTGTFELLLQENQDCIPTQSQTLLHACLLSHALRYIYLKEVRSFEDIREIENKIFNFLVTIWHKVVVIKLCYLSELPGKILGSKCPGYTS